MKRLVKILLLGAGESGKSTFLKQMRIIHGEDFDQQAREDFRGTIYSNVIKGNPPGGRAGTRQEGNGLSECDRSGFKSGGKVSTSVLAALRW